MLYNGDYSHPDVEIGRSTVATEFRALMIGSCLKIGFAPFKQRRSEKAHCSGTLALCETC